MSERESSEARVERCLCGHLKTDHAQFEFDCWVKTCGCVRYEWEGRCGWLDRVMQSGQPIFCYEPRDSPNHRHVKEMCGGKGHRPDMHCHAFITFPKSLSDTESALIRAYQWRQKRYAKNSFGTGRSGGNALNETYMANEIAYLEALVEEMGGDPRRCLEHARGEKPK